MADALATASEPELKYERFRQLLLEQAKDQEHRDHLTALTFPLFMELVSAFATPHYLLLTAFRDKCQTAKVHDDDARQWVKKHAADIGDLIASGLLPYLPRCNTDLILRVVRYIIYFIEIAVITKQRAKEADAKEEKK